MFFCQKQWSGKNIKLKKEGKDLQIFMLCLKKFLFFYDHVLKVNGVVRLSFGLKCNLGYGYI